MTTQRDRSEGGSGSTSTHPVGVGGGDGKRPATARHTPPRGVVVKVVAAAQPRPRTSPPAVDFAEDDEVTAVADTHALADGSGDFPLPS